MNVPFLDLKAQYRSIQPQIDEAIQAVIDQTAFAGGPFVSRFESEFAAYCQADYSAAVGSGTEALWLVLMALDIGPGDEVITVPNTFIATAEAISLCGAIPVFVDITDETATMDPALLEPAITDKTKAIIPVHLYGQPADMDRILEIANRHDLPVIEDACQAHGAEYKGRRTGSLGRAGCFSFYPGKNLGAYGEGGAVVTNDVDLVARIRMLRDHGSSSKYYHAVVGCNARLDGIQGAILSAKLPHLDGWNDQRRAHAQQYDELLSNVPGITRPIEADYARHVYHVYAIRVDRRDELRQQLEETGVQTGIHYPCPLHRQAAYAPLGIPEGRYPVSEQHAQRLLSLPMFPELTDEQIQYTVEQLIHLTESQRKTNEGGCHENPSR